MMAITEAELQVLLNNQRAASGEPIAKAKAPKPRMNKLEAAYAEYLRERLHFKAISWYAFEPIKLRLADHTYYTPDFAVRAHELEFHEVKGFWRDDARVKIKVAAEMYPFLFYGITRGKNGEWVREYFRGKADIFEFK